MSEGKHLVGVDIGSSSIKVCELKEGRRGARQLVRFAYHPLPPQTIVDGHIINSAAVVEGLDKLFHKQKNRDVALRVSGHSVIIKKITMPLMTSAELREQINWEAEQHIPFDLAEVEIDWQVLQQRQEQGQMDVLLVAAKKEEVNDLTNIAAEAKLRPRVVDLDAFTVQNAFEVTQQGGIPTDRTIALIHVGASLTTLNILSAGTTAFTRDIANGGNQITEEIQRSLGISAEEAEAYKCGGDGRGLVPREVPEIVQQVVEQLAGEIQRSLDFYLATSGEGEVHRVVVSGGTANIRALLDAIERRARVPVELLDPLRIAEAAPKADDASLLQARAAQAAVAFGLALRREREKLQ
ncbi:type IV pilus assembly protein PilM [Sandaracinus amylolyticus]|uniref:Type IV pilus biogenesis protein PilM n=1 Tax=Sandaracinus amylolyticus TaxID=927083 RepID=A0A0F6YLI0_9BACT|nr:type IV pilus assembly protein PilM [Sandaracinus amylolyticus]AKF08363.1 Type IV pilus biogenesis protein PilM [Sandaracinus amylolyticus]